MFTQRKHYAGQLSLDVDSDAKCIISPLEKPGDRAKKRGLEERKI